MRFLVHDNKRFYGFFGENYKIDKAPSYPLVIAKTLCKRYRAYPVPIEDKLREDYIRNNFFDFLMAADISLLEFIVKVDSVLTIAHLYSNSCEERGDYWRYPLYLEYSRAHKLKFKEEFKFSFPERYF